jgi:hypothetical protein
MAKQTATFAVMTGCCEAEDDAEPVGGIAVPLPVPAGVLVVIAIDDSTLILDEAVSDDELVLMVLLLEVVLVVGGVIVHVVSGTTVPGGINPLGMVA